MKKRGNILFSAVCPSKRFLWRSIGFNRVFEPLYDPLLRSYGVFLPLNFNNPSNCSNA